MGFFSKLFGGGKSAEGSGLTCLSCDATDVTELAPDAYRCNVCGYEGGDGYAAWQAQQNVAALAGQSEDALRARAIEELEAVRLMLVGVGGEVQPSALDQAAGMSRGIEIADGVTLTIGSGGAPGGGGQMGAFAQMEAEEAARLAQQRRMDLLEARAAAQKLHQTLTAWDSKPGHVAPLDEPLSIADALLVDENTKDRRLHELQVLIHRARTALSS